MPLPKAVQAWIAANPEKVSDAFTELGEFFNDRQGWEHWVYLKGWRNDVVDPLEPIHLIHESTGKEVMRQLRGIKPCDCESCRKGES